MNRPVLLRPCRDHLWFAPYSKLQDDYDDDYETCDNFDNHYHLNPDLLKKDRNEDNHFHFIFFCKKVKTHLDRTAEGCGKFEEAEEAASGRNVCAVTIMENYHYCNHDYYHYWHFNCHLFV